MSKRTVLSMAAMLLVSLVSAQSFLEGKVIDQRTRQPLARATVTFGDGRPVVTDDLGQFHSGRLKNNEVFVTVTAIGYRTLTGQFHTGTPTTLEMQPADQLMQPIEVRAVRAQDKTPFTQTTIHAAEIAKLNQGQDLPFLLNQTPSVIVNSDAGNGVGYTGIRIRGTDATRINVTLNGIPYNDAESQGVYFVDLPDFASSVGSIQVQRGVGTSSNGAGAFGATVNMSTNEVKERAYLQLNNSFGSFNTWKNTLVAGTGLLGGHFTLDGRLSRISSDGYIDRAKSNLRSFYTSAAWINDKSSLRLNIFSGHEKTYQAWYGVPEELMATDRTYNPAGTEKSGTPYDNQTDNYTQTHYQLFFNHAITSKLALNVAGFYTRGKGYYEEYKAAQDPTAYAMEYPIVGNDTIRETDLVRQRWLDNHFYGSIFSLQYKDKRDDLIFGGGWNKYDGGHFGKVTWVDKGTIPGQPYYENDAIKTDFNLYGKWMHEIAPGWNSFADLQWRKVDYAINGFDYNPALRINNHWNFVNPKAGISYSHKGWQAYFSYALAHKEPNRDDFEAATDQQPVPETLHDFELGFEKRQPDWAWGLTGFYMRYKNQLVLTGKINSIGAYTRTNIPNSYRTGVELTGRWKGINWFRASGNLSLSANRIIDFTEYIDDYDNGGQKVNTYAKSNIALSPSVIGQATLEFIPTHGLEIAMLSKYVSKQYLDNTSKDSRSLAAYFNQDLRISWTIPQRWFKQAMLICQVNNLFNAKYSPSGYTYSYYYGGSLVTSNNYYPMAVRNAMISLNLSF